VPAATKARAAKRVTADFSIEDFRLQIFSAAHGSVGTENLKSSI